MSISKKTRTRNRYKTQITIETHVIFLIQTNPRGPINVHEAWQLVHRKWFGVIP